MSMDVSPVKYSDSLKTTQSTFEIHLLFITGVSKAIKERVKSPPHPTHPSSFPTDRSKAVPLLQFFFVVCAFVV